MQTVFGVDKVLNVKMRQRRRFKDSKKKKRKKKS